jgi:hypothetical protein
MEEILRGSDAEFHIGVKTIIEGIIANKDSLSVKQAALDSLQQLLDAWSADYAAQLAAASAFHAATDRKDAARQLLVKALRAVVKIIQSDPDVSNELRNKIGVPEVNKTQRTAAGKPKTRPITVIDTSRRLQHLIAFADETTPKKTAKPKGVHHIEVWLCISDAAPKDDSEFTLVATDSNTPYLYQFKSTDLGKTAYYKFRWVSTTDEPGDFSEVVSAVIR